MKQDRRGSWYLLTGVVIGLALGLVYSWVVSPVKYIDAPPYALREDYKEQYRVLVASAYLYSGDLLRAQDRLKKLKDENIAQTLAKQAQRALAEGHPDEEVKALSQLATALSKVVTPVPDSSTSIPGSTLDPGSSSPPPALMIASPTISITETDQPVISATEIPLTPIP